MTKVNSLNQAFFNSCIYESNAGVILCVYISDDLLLMSTPPTATNTKKQFSVALRDDGLGAPPSNEREVDKIFACCPDDGNVRTKFSCCRRRTFVSLIFC